MLRTRATRAAALMAMAATASISSAASAQIVNVQPLVARDDKPGASLSVEASADQRSGNTDLATLSGSVIGAYRWGRHLFFALARGDYGVLAGKRFAEDDLEHLRYRVALAGPLEAEAFVQHDHDAFRRLGLRTLLGAGPRLHVKLGDALDAAIGASYMLETEVIQACDGALCPNGPSGAADEHVDHRGSAYATIAVKAADTVRVGATLYAQPQLDDFADYRVLEETELLVSATKHLSFKLALSMMYDSRPPAGVDPLDSERKASLVVSF